MHFNSVKTRFAASTRLATLRLILGCVAGLAGAVAQGQEVLEFLEESDPFGVFVTDPRYVDSGTQQSTRTAADVVSGYRFAVWELNGVEQRDELGVALNPVVFTIQVPVRAVAKYLVATQDTLGDGVMDALKVRYYGTVDTAANSDTDGDGFDFATELARGYHPKVADEPLSGGIASRRSARLSVATDLTLAWVVQRSEPLGFVSRTGWEHIGTALTLQTAPDDQSGYRFVGWYRDGVRLDDPLASATVVIEVDAAAVDLVARYVPAAFDSDGDSVPDYLEWYYYGGLDILTGNDDSDGDGFGILEEAARGYHPLVADEPVSGGIASRRSARLEYNSGYFPYAFVSVPVGLLSQSGLAEDGTELLTPELYRDQRSGHVFAYWSVEGVAQRMASGEALSQLAFQVDGPVEASAHYFGATTDSVGDGVPDWQKLAYYPTLAAGAADSDSDGDGFDFATEMARGYHPHYVDEPVAGGIASRRSARKVMLLNVLVWGANTHQQLEIPEVLFGRALAAVVSGPNHNLALTQDGQVYGWGDNAHGQVDIPAFGQPVLKVATGRAHGLALLEDGSVVAWGRNDFGQCTLPAGLSQVADIAAGGDHNLALTHDGRVIAWGRNESGQVEVRTLPAAPVAIAAGGAHSVVVLADGSLVAWGDDTWGQSTVPVEATNIRSVVCGEAHTVALRADGRVIAWGDNREGQIDVPGDFAVAPPGPTAARVASPMEGESATVVELAAGSEHNLLLLSDGSVRAWGRNESGQASAPDTLTDAGAISAGSAHSVVLRRAAMLPTAQADEQASLRKVVLQSVHGRITRSPYQVQYTDGQVVTFTATPAEGYVFAGWSGALTGMQSSALLTVAGDVYLTANFVPEGGSPDGFLAWQTTHFGSSANAPSQVLKQGRMVTLIEAFLLGGNPLDPNDVATAVMEPGDGALLRLRIDGLRGRRYQLQNSATLDALDWLPSGSSVSGNNAPIDWDISPDAERPFYRIQILAEESP